MRTLIDLPDSLASHLDEQCRRESISRAEGVRRAIAAYLASRPIDDPEAGFGIWKDRKIDSRKYVDALRNEW
jgi:metal-responsive CopG/Arc/MetJ family transcriptional regulator